MLSYVIIFLFVALSGYLETMRIEPRAKKLFTFICFSMLALFAGLRGEVGYDYDTYEEIFDLSGEISSWGNFKKDIPELHGEPGFILTAALFKKIGIPFNLFLLFFACVTMFVIYKTQKKYESMFLVGILIYLSRFYLFREFGQIRAGLSIAILVYATTYLAEDKNGKYFLYMVLASLFHSIALLGIPFYFFYRINLTTKVIYLLLIAGFILGAINWISFLFPVFEMIFPAQTFAAYFLWDQYAYPLGLTNPVLLAQTIFVLLFYHNRDKLSGRVKYYDIILKAYLFSTLWLAVFNKVAVIAGRTATVYATLEIFIVPSFILLVKEKYIAYILIAMYAAAIFFLNMSKDLDIFIPYKLFFQ